MFDWWDMVENQKEIVWVEGIIMDNQEPRFDWWYVVENRKEIVWIEGIIMDKRTLILHLIQIMMVSVLCDKM